MASRTSPAGVPWKPATGLVFDFDGIIADTNKLSSEGMRRFLHGRGLPFDEQFLRRNLTGRSLRDSTAFVQREFGIAEDVDTLLAERVEINRKVFAEGADFIPGFEEFFDRHVAGRIPAAIGTSARHDLFSILDTRLNLRQRFNGHVVTSDQVEHAKPAPDIFLAAAATIGIDPSQLIVIEDSPTGIEAARRAGMRVAALTTTHERSKLDGADAVLSSYAELPAALAQLRLRGITTSRPGLGFSSVQK